MFNRKTHQIGISTFASDKNSRQYLSLLARVGITSRSVAQKGGGVEKSPHSVRLRFIKVLVVLTAVTTLSGCATLVGSPLPSCANVRGYYSTDIPIGAERVGSHLWIERRLIYSNQIGPVIRAVAAGLADGEWQAGRLQTPLLIENGLWKTTIATGLIGPSPYDVNFDARAWQEPQFTTARIERRTVEIYLHVFGPELGNYGLERILRMAALKYRGAPDTDWAICPVRW